MPCTFIFFFFFFNDTATTEIYTLSLHDALPISGVVGTGRARLQRHGPKRAAGHRSEEHTSELQSPCNLVCRLLLEKKKKKQDEISCRARRQTGSPSACSACETNEPAIPQLQLLC